MGLVLGPLLFVALLFVPGLPLDAPQRRAAAVTALTAVWWITLPVPLGAASLLPVVLFPLLGVMSAREAAPVYMHDLVLLFLGAFVIALGLERWGVHRRIALFVISAVGTAPRNLVLGFMVASAFLSMWIANTATTLLMLPIGLAVVGQVEAHGDGEDRGHFAMCLLLGIAWSSSMGGTGTPVGTAPNQVFLGQFAERFPDAPAFSFGEWMFGWLPLVVLFVPLAWLLMTRVLLPVSGEPAGEVDAVRKERAALGPMTSAQKRMGVVFAVTAFLWVTRADLDLGLLRLPGWSRLFLPAEATPESYALYRHHISDSTVAIGMALVCFLVPSGEGRGVMLADWRTAVRLPWDVLLLFGGGFCIAKGFQVTGLDQEIGAVLAPLFAGRSAWVVVLGTALFVSFLTEITSNAATTAVLLPVLAGSAIEGGLDPLVVMVPATIAASAAFMMPVATPPNAVVFSSRRIPPLVMARTGFWLNLLAVFLATAVFQLWVRRLWNVGDGLPDWAR